MRPVGQGRSTVYSAGGVRRQATLDASLPAHNAPKARCAMTTGPRGFGGDLLKFGAGIQPGEEVPSRMYRITSSAPLARYVPRSSRTRANLPASPGCQHGIVAPDADKTSSGTQVRSATHPRPRVTRKLVPQERVARDLQGLLATVRVTPGGGCQILPLWSLPVNGAHCGLS